MEIDSYIIFGTYVPNVIANGIVKMQSNKEVYGLEELNNVFKKKFGVELLEINMPIGITDNNFKIEKRYFLNIPFELSANNIIPYEQIKDPQFDKRIESFKNFCEVINIKNNEPTLFSIPYVRTLIKKEKLGLSHKAENFRK